MLRNAVVIPEQLEYSALVVAGMLIMMTMKASLESLVLMMMVKAPLKRSMLMKMTAPLRWVRFPLIVLLHNSPPRCVPTTL